MQRVPPRSHQGCEATTGFVPQTKRIHVRQWERHQDGSAARPCQTPTAVLLGNERSKTSLSPLPYLLSSCLKKKPKTSLGQPGRPSRAIWGTPSSPWSPCQPQPHKAAEPPLASKGWEETQAHPAALGHPAGTPPGRAGTALRPRAHAPGTPAPRHPLLPSCVQMPTACFPVPPDLPPLFFLFYFIFLPPPFLPFFFLG